MRQRGTGSVVQRGRIWWLRYSLNGKRYEESSGSLFKHDAEALLKKRLDSPLGESANLNELLDELLEEQQFNKRKSIYKNKSHIKPLRLLLGNRKIIDITESVIRIYQRERLAQVSNPPIVTGKQTYVY